jgi:DMSO/TMAO reductase YedYZ molybdopterin-dependent catalytic subunit
MIGRRAAAVAVGLAIASAASAQTLAVRGLSGQQANLTAADLAAMPHTPVTLQLEGGRSERCEGVLLSAILAKVGAPQGKALRGPEMADVVLISAADGYHVALALAETDAGFRTTKVVLADRCNGAAIAPPEGPLRLVIEGDLRPARSAREVTGIAVERVAPAR